MGDFDVGKYVAPALLLQEETTKVLLEPIARSAPAQKAVANLREAASKPLSKASLKWALEEMTINAQ